MAIGSRMSRRWLALVVASVVGAAGAAADAAPRSEPNTQRTTIQPGAGLYNPYLDQWCTLGFLLKDTAGVVYGVTGGDCARDHRPPPGFNYYEPWYGSRTWAKGKGPFARALGRTAPVVGQYVAQVVTNNSQQTYVTNSGWPLNYSIFRLDPRTRYSGTVAVVGGPNRAPYTGRTDMPTALTFVCIDGDIVNYDDVRPVYDDGVHRGLAPLGLGSPTFVLASVAITACQGAPVLDADGNAVAIYGAGGYRVDAIIAAAQKQLGVSLRLVPAGESGEARR